MSSNHRVWLSETEALRLPDTEAIPELSPSDKLPETALAEQIIHGLHKTMAQYVAAHPGRLSRFASRAIVDLYRALDKHNLAELSTRLSIAVGEIEQQESVAIEPQVRQALDEAERFLAHGMAAVKARK